MSVRDTRTVMADLAASGLTPEQMALMLELTAALSSSGAGPVDARSKAAIRQERYRENLRNKSSQSVTEHNNVTKNVTCDADVTFRDGEAPESPPLPPPPLLPPQTPPITPPPPAPPHETGAHVGDGLFGGDEGGNGDGESTEKPKKKPKSKACEPFIRPDDIPADAWAGFEEMRQRKRAPLTDRARHGILKKLRKFAEHGHPPGDVLDQSTMNSYTDVYELKDRKNGSGNSQQSGNGYARPRSRSEEMDDAMRDLGFDQPIH